MVLPAPRIVGEKEPQRVSVEHAAVDGGQLVRQGLDQRGVHRHMGIEQVRQADAECLRGQPKQLAVAIEGEASRWRDLLERWLVLAIEDAFAEAIGTLPRHFDRVGSVRACGDDLHRRVTQHARHAAPRNDALQLHHWNPVRVSRFASLWRTISTARDTMPSDPPTSYGQKLVTG